MKKMKKFVWLPLALLLTVATSCESLLDIKNENSPTITDVLSSADDVEGIISALYNTVYVGEHSFSGVQMMLATASDNVSCSWGNQAMRDMSWEPRDYAWVNTPSYSYRGTIKHLFDKSYSAINTASTALIAMEGGIDMGSDERNDRARAVCKFVQGVAFGDLALVFDKAFIVDENTTVEPVLEAASPYTEVADAALSYLDEAIALSATEFTIPADWLGTEADLTNVQFRKLCNTYAARIMAYLPRTKTELLAVDWAKVKTYADAGIDFDFNVVNDAYVLWYHEAGDYLTYNGWGVTDMYVVNLMDAGQPQHWTDDASFPHPPASTNILTDDNIDDRLDSDFAYIGSNWFQAARGYYHYSNYRSKRYDAFYVNASGPRSEILKAENDMLRAEARIYGGAVNLAEAATIVNNSTRSTRGNLPDVAADADEIAQAIHHERHVELYVTGMGLQFFEMRKLDLLQEGTPLHLPIPAETMQSMGLLAPFYTFGTVAEADGVNTSNAGWR